MLLLCVSKLFDFINVAGNQIPVGNIRAFNFSTFVDLSLLVSVLLNCDFVFFGFAVEFAHFLVKDVLRWSLFDVGVSRKFRQLSCFGDFNGFVNWAFAEFVLVLPGVWIQLSSSSAAGSSALVHLTGAPSTSASSWTVMVLAVIVSSLGSLASLRLFNLLVTTSIRLSRMRSIGSFSTSSTTTASARMRWLGVSLINFVFLLVVPVSLLFILHRN